MEELVFAIVIRGLSRTRYGIVHVEYRPGLFRVAMGHGFRELCVCLLFYALSVADRNVFSGKHDPLLQPIWECLFFYHPNFRRWGPCRSRCILPDDPWRGRSAVRRVDHEPERARDVVRSIDLLFHLRSLPGLPEGL